MLSGANSRKRNFVGHVIFLLLTDNTGNLLFPGLWEKAFSFEPVSNDFGDPLIQDLLLFFIADVIRTVIQKSVYVKKTHKRLKYWSGQRDLNPQRSAWEADTLPLSYARIRKKAYDKVSLDSFVERETGFEPATSTLARLHSTTELLPRGGDIQIRTGDQGFADLCLTTWLCRHENLCWSGRRDLNPRLQPWQGCTLPLSYSRVA